jgi:hypothetical protein
LSKDFRFYHKWKGKTLKGFEKKRKGFRGLAKMIRALKTGNRVMKCILEKD